MKLLGDAKRYRTIVTPIQPPFAFSAEAKARDAWVETGENWQYFSGTREPTNG